MGRVALACLAFAAALTGAAPSLAGANSQPPRTQLEGFGCHRSSDSLNRWIAVTAVMRPVTGTQRMAMKFELLRKPPRAAGYTQLTATGSDLGKWIHPTDPPTLGSRPGDHWTVQKQVVNLSAPALYKFRVSFRWLGSDSRSLGTVVHSSQVCSQY